MSICYKGAMLFSSIPKAHREDKVAVMSPSFAAPALFPEVHEQALVRLQSETGLIPVEYGTTRQLGATAQERAADLNQAFADPDIRAVLATIGGSDQVTVIPHLDADLIRANPKPFLGYSDNTNLHNFLWNLGIPSFYGGSTQVHLGSGPAADELHLLSLRAALLTGDTLELFDPGMSEDFGVTWEDPRSLTEFGVREKTDPWVWSGPKHHVRGRTWGGCLEVLDQLAMAGRFPEQKDIEGTILLLETSEELPPADQVMRWVRGLGERGLLGEVVGVLVARPPVTALGGPSLTGNERAALRAAQREAIVSQVAHYNPNAVVCVGLPFGHTRPQWIVPYGGYVSMDGLNQVVTAEYR